MKQFRYENTEQEVTDAQGPVIFLAGPTVRGHQQHLLPSWRTTAVEILEGLKFEGSVVIPEFSNPDGDDRHKLWIPKWEYNGLKRADCILFWIPRTKELIGLTTNWEHGYWVGRKISKVVYGRPEDSYRNNYPDFMWEFIHGELGVGFSIYTTLEDTLKAAIHTAQKFDTVRQIEHGYTGNYPDDSARF